MQHMTYTSQQKHKTNSCGLCYICLQERERERVKRLKKKKKKKEEEEDRNVKRVNCVFMDINKQIGQIGR